MKRNGVDGDAHLRGRGLVVMPLDQQLEEAFFLSREGGRGAWRGAAPVEELDDAPRDLRRHRRASADRILDALEQARRWRLLQKVTARARAESREDPFVVLVDGQDEQNEIGKSLVQHPNALDAGHARQPDVHQHDVGPARVDRGDRVLHGPEGGLDATDARPVEQRGQPFADLLAILDDGYADHGMRKDTQVRAKGGATYLGRGRSSRRVVPGGLCPEPAAVSTSTRPPSSVARDRMLDIP